MPLWHLIHVHPPHGWLRWLEFLPVIVGVALIAFVVFGNAGGSEEGTPEEPTPITIAPARYEPLKLVNLTVDPPAVRVGEMARLLNGICNNTDAPVTAQVYLGAQEQGRDPLVARTIDLIGRDTPEGRERRTIAPGCIGTDPIVAPLPASFTPGRWQLSLRVIATSAKGEMQFLTATSPVFTVVQ